MSDADLKANIAVSTDVEQATQKTQKGIVSLQKQVEDIQKKFSTAGKDIFLGFFAPMAILQTAISFITDKIAQAKQDAKDGIELISQGSTIYSNAEEAKAAAFFKRKKQLDDEKKLVIAGREEITKQILENEAGQFKDFQLPSKYVQLLKGGSESIASLSANKEVQRLALDYFSKTDAGKRILESMGATDALKPNSYKAPEGVNSVVGIGPNAALQATLDSLEEQRKQTMLLEQIASSGSYTPPDFTKPASSAAPSRSYLLKK